MRIASNLIVIVLSLFLLSTTTVSNEDEFEDIPVIKAESVERTPSQQQHQQQKIEEEHLHFVRIQFCTS